jgi:D-amino-acid dehydrogenase
VTKHVVVVGAGAIGLSVGLCCAERGWRVTVVERNGDERDGCSFGNAGIIVPSHFIPLAAPGAVAQALKWMVNPASPFYLKPRASWDLIAWGMKFWRASNAEHVRRTAPLLRDLNLASRACYEELAGVGNDFDLVDAGTLMLCKTPHGLAEEARTAQYAQTLGLRADVLDRDDTAALEPGVRMDVAGSVYFPMDCKVIPDRFVGAMQRRLVERGARFAWNTNVSGYRVEGSKLRAIVSSEHDIEGDEFVLAAGSWSDRLARSVGVKVPLQAGKGYSLTLPNPPVLPKRAAILTEARVAVSAMGRALRVGGTMEIAGLDETVNPIRVRSIIEAVARYYPDFTPADFEGVTPWRGLRPCSPDGLPFIGRTRRYSNLFVATGHAMMGMSLAPITGKLAAQVLAGEKPSVDLSLLSPDRYN